MSSYTKTPILITGLPRSGTSMTTALIDAGGAFGGNVLGPTPANRKGQFENRRICRTVVKRYLKTLNSDPLGQCSWPDLRNLDPTENNPFHKLLEIIQEDGWDGDCPWYYKEPKMCLIWPAVHNVYPDAKWVICRRNSSDIIRSCKRTAWFRSTLKTEQQWTTWLNHHLDALEQIKDNCQAREVWPYRFLNGDFSELVDVLDWLGLHFNEEVANEFVDRSLWHGKT